jgi:ankyrin repeat protein
VVRELLDRGADPNAATGRGTTALMVASSYGYVDTTIALLDRGADPNATNRYGSTPLSIANEHGHMAVVQLLIAAIKEGKEYCETDVCTEYAINGKKFCSECLDNTNDDNDGGGGRFP